MEKGKSQLYKSRHIISLPFLYDLRYDSFMISTQFLQNCMAGDEEAIRTLVRAHQRGVFQLALSILDDCETSPGLGVSGPHSHPSEVVKQAEAATREVFIKAIDRLGRYREDTPFEIWLYTLTIDLTLRRYRRWRVQRWWAGLFRRVREKLFRPNEFLAEDAAAHENLPTVDLELWSAVRQLKEKLRVPVVLRYYHDFPIHEIAKMLHLSEGAVHARLDSAREKLAARENLGGRETVNDHETTSSE